MIDATDKTTLTTEADLFREEAARARRYAATMIDMTVVQRLNEIADAYEELAAGQGLGPADRE